MPNAALASCEFGGEKATAVVVCVFDCDRVNSPTAFQ